MKDKWCSAFAVLMRRWKNIGNVWSYLFITTVTYIRSHSTFKPLFSFVVVGFLFFYSFFYLQNGNLPKPRLVCALCDLQIIANCILNKFNGNLKTHGEHGCKVMAWCIMFTHLSIYLSRSVNLKLTKIRT